MPLVVHAGLMTPAKRLSKVSQFALAVFNLEIQKHLKHNYLFEGKHAVALESRGEDHNYGGFPRLHKEG